MGPANFWALRATRAAKQSTCPREAEMTNRGIMTERRSVLAASTGGHLAQLHKLRSSLEVGNRPLWVTFDNPQSRSLLEGEDVVYLPYIKSRDLFTALRCIPTLLGLFRSHEFERVVSTGAAIAVPVFLAAALTKVDRTYLESVSRFDGPSLSGQIVSRIPGTTLLTQHGSWANSRWKKGPSVLDSYVVEERAAPEKERLRIFITLGTIKPYRFDRVVESVVERFSGSYDLVWQLGSTERLGLPGEVHSLMSADEFDRNVRESDAVISHAGVGSALRILSLGKSPILVPRLRAYKEHVDDHQLQITRELAAHGLAVEAGAADLGPEHVALSCSRRVVTTEHHE